MKSKKKSPMKAMNDCRSQSRVTALAVAVMLISSAILPSCNTSGCTDNRSSIPLAGFYSASDELSISLDSIEMGGVGAPADSLMLHAGEKASEVYMPLRSTATQTSWFIAYRYKDLDLPELNDTITFSYESIPFFASEECGAMFHYRLRQLTYTTHILDSVAVTAVDSVFTNANIETLRLYFRTSNNDQEL